MAEYPVAAPIPVIVRTKDMQAVAERLARVVNEELQLGALAREKRQASILAGMLATLLTMIEACGPFRPGALLEVERAARECLNELLSMSDLTKTPSEQPAKE